MGASNNASGAVAAIGNFDGVHRGHLYLLEETLAFAGAHDAPAAVVTFDPHPRRFFKPDEAPFALTTPVMRDALLRAHGVDEIFTLSFDRETAGLTPEAFVETVLRDQLGLKGVVVGADFRFGAARAGDAGALTALGAAAGLEVRIAQVVADDGASEKFSSSAVRAALRNGDAKAAAAMLGRAWAVCGRVAEGQKLGRTLGFPTANLTLGDLLEPRFGVYATRVHVGEETYRAVSNFGLRPTVGMSAPMLETHLFDFSDDLYGREIEVEFVDFLRPERKFDGLEALKAQISVDCAAARALLA